MQVDSFELDRLAKLRRYSETSVSELEAAVALVEVKVNDGYVLAAVPYDWRSPADIIAEFLADKFGQFQQMLNELKLVDPDEVIAGLVALCAALGTFADFIIR